jgi:hypothetical protein
MIVVTRPPLGYRKSLTGTWYDKQDFGFFMNNDVLHDNQTGA